RGSATWGTRTTGRSSPRSRSSTTLSTPIALRWCAAASRMDSFAERASVGGGPGGLWPPPAGFLRLSCGPDCSAAPSRMAHEGDLTGREVYLHAEASDNAHWARVRASQPGGGNMNRYAGRKPYSAALAVGFSVLLGAGLAAGDEPACLELVQAIPLKGAPG